MLKEKDIVYEAGPYWVARVPPSYYERTGKLCAKIELHTLTQDGWTYRYTTQWSKTCREAKERYCLAYGVDPKRVRARFKR